MEIVGMVRGLDVAPEELAAFIKRSVALKPGRLILWKARITNMKNLNMKRSKRLTGMVCMMLSIFLLTMPLLGMAAAQDVSGNDAPAAFVIRNALWKLPIRNARCVRKMPMPAKGKRQSRTRCPVFARRNAPRAITIPSAPPALPIWICVPLPRQENRQLVSARFCAEGAVNPDCAVCQSDRAQCIGKAPDTSTEPEQPTEPDTPTEPEPPAEPEKCNLHR